MSTSVSSITASPTRIYGFHQPGYEWLSNFYVEKDGLTNEHRYQACKATNIEDYDYVMSAPSPGEAKRRGREIKSKPNWKQIRYDMMLQTLREKFQDRELREKLLSTFGMELIEANWWKDLDWGVDIETGEGLNLLGKALMQLRAEFIEEEARENDSYALAEAFDLNDKYDLDQMRSRSYGP